MQALVRWMSAAIWRRLFEMEVLILVAMAAIACLSQPVAREHVVLLPGADGRAGAVMVKTARGEQLINQPYAAITVDQQGGMLATQDDPQQVSERFSANLAAQPQRPLSYLVYFESGKDVLAAESLAVLEQLKITVKTRQVPEIVAIGHTDRVGNLKENDALSLKRAEKVREILLHAGLRAGNIEIAGRGEREPLVFTADEVEEARNRRVEISVR